MINSIQNGTGNSRYLKSNIPSNISFADFIAQLRAGTLPIDLGAINPAGWAVLGNPLNKDTLLKDSTAAIYGLPSTAVPNDVFDKLGRIGIRKFVYNSGTSTFIAPRTGWYVVEVIGGGGWFPGYTDQNTGSSGGYAMKSIFLTIGSSVVVTVGSAAYKIGSPGGTSSFGSYLSATGGLNQNTPGIGIGGDLIVDGSMGGVGNENVAAASVMSSFGYTPKGPGTGGGDRSPAFAGIVIVTCVA